MKPWLRFFHMSFGDTAPVAFLRVLVLATPFINMFNGWWLEGHGRATITPGQVIAMLFIMFGTTILLVQKSKKLKYLILMCIAFVPSLIICWLLSGHVFGSIVWYSRLYFTTMVYALCMLGVNSGEKMGNVFKLLAIAGAIVGWSLVICKLFGLGQSTYVTGVGFKGLYYAQNELSATIVMLFPFVVQHFLIRRRLVPLLNCAITFGGMMLIGTKSTVVFGVLTLVILIGRALFRSRFFKVGRSSKNGLLLIGAIGIVLIALTIIFHSSFTRIYNYQLYFFEKRNLTAYLTSGRTYTLPILWQVLKAYPWAVVTGVGYTTENLLLTKFAGTPTILEFDPLTLLLSGGLISVITCFAVFINTAHCMFRRALISNQTAVFISLLFGIASSVLAGHVLDSSIAGIYLAVIAAFTVYSMNKLQSQSSEPCSGDKS